MSAVDPIRTLIVDDEAPARSRLRHLLKERQDFSVVGECSQGQEAVDAIREQSPELVFLDVQMPRLNGFDVCAAVGPAQMPAVVFVTAYDKYALEAFSVHAVDYLLKPIEKARFDQTLDHLQARLRAPGATSNAAQAQILSLLGELKQPSRGTERLAIKVDGRVLVLKVAEIDWLEAEGNYVRLHVGGANHLFRDTLSSLESGLPTDRFLRISRSTIVNVDSVREFQPMFYGDHVVIMRDGAKLTQSRTFRDRLDKLLALRG